MGFLINKKRDVNVTYCKPYKNGILSKSTRVQNPPDQNQPDLKSNRVEENTLLY